MTPSFTEAYAGYLLHQQARNLSAAYLSLLALTRTYWLEQRADCEIASITADDIRRWLVWLREEREMSGASADIHFRNIKAFWLWAEKEELCEFGKSPIRKVERPSFREKQPDVLTEDEYHELLKRVRGDADRNAYRDYCILLFFLDTGVRLSELASLNQDDVNLQQGYARVLGKGDKERYVTLGLELRQSLSRYRLKHRQAIDGETALFTNEHGLRFDANGVRSMVVRALNDYVPRELRKVGPHTLRHTAITYDLVYNGDIDATSEMAGHADVKTTRRYNHLAAIMRRNRVSPMDATRNKGEKRHAL